MRCRQKVYVDGGVLINYPVKLFDRLKYVTPENRDATTRATPKYYTDVNNQFLKDHPDSSPYVYNKETLGLRLDSKKEIACFRHDELPTNKVNNLPEYIEALVKTILESQNNTHLQDDDWQRTVYIDNLGVSTIDFGLSDDTKRKLVDSGKQGVQDYLKWFDDPRNPAANRL